jgi:predicted transposase YbfD/YdcC
VSSLSMLVALLDQPSSLQARVQRGSAGLMKALESIADLRQRKGRRFELVTVLALAVFAVWCGASTFAVIAETVADLDRQMLAGFGVRRRPPSAATFRRVLNQVDPVELDEALSVWATATDTTREPEPAGAGQGLHLPADPVVDLVVAMDGKTLKGARRWDEAGVMRQDAVVETVEHGTRLVHGLVRIVDGDENAAVLGMIDRIAARRGGSLTGVVITADAKHTTKELTAKVIELGGHYLLTVKGNAPTAHAALDSLPWATITNAHTTREKGHGRQETRAIRLVTLPGQIAGRTGLTGVLQAGRVRRSTRRKKTVTTPAAWTHENVYIVTSLSHRQACAARVARILREHWSCEVIHWQRDVVFGEDGHTARTGNGPINLAILRNTALTRDNTNGITASAKTLRARARRPERALLTLTA